MNEMEKTQVYCVHFLYIRDGKIIEMLPRTVKELKDAGVIITLNGKPEGEQIPMNWEPDIENNAWIGNTELSSSIVAMAHLVNGVPNIERKECPYFTQVTGR